MRIFPTMCHISVKMILLAVMSVGTAMEISENRATYEYVVVGSGPGGGPLA